MKNLLLLSLIISALYVKSYAQPFQKGDMLVGTGVEVAKLLPDQQYDSTNALPVITNFEYIFLAKDKLSLGIGVKAEFFKTNIKYNKYFDAKIGLPVNLHFSPFRKFDAFLGYCIYGHYYFYNTPALSYKDRKKWSLNSEMYLGFQYFLTENFGLYSRFATDGLRVSVGTTYKF